MNVPTALVCSLLTAAIFALIGTAYLRRNQVGPQRGVPIAALVAFSVAGSFAIIQNAATPAVIIIVPAAIVCLYTDLRYGLILDIVTFPALGLLLLCAGSALPHALSGCVLGAGAIGLILLSTAGRGIGFGDLKLAACIGAAFGFFGGAYAIGLAFVFGAVHGSFLLATKRASGKTALRFAPYLAAGVLAVAFGRLAS